MYNCGLLIERRTIAWPETRENRCDTECTHVGVIPSFQLYDSPSWFVYHAQKCLFSSTNFFNRTYETIFDFIFIFFLLFLFCFLFFFLFRSRLVRHRKRFQFLLNNFTRRVWNDHWFVLKDIFFFFDKRWANFFYLDIKFLRTTGLYIQWNNMIDIQILVCGWNKKYASFFYLQLNRSLIRYDTYCTWNRFKSRSIRRIFYEFLSKLNSKLIKIN